MNLYINKHKYAQRDKLRRMQKHDPKSYWKFLNSLKTKQKSEAPSAEEFHAFFKDIYNSELSDNETRDSMNFEFEAQTEELNKPFSEAEINKCILKLKNSKAPGHDNILNEFIKITKQTMLPIYVSLFNIILHTGLIPESWSIGKIRPIFKNNGNPLDPNNYRPITILSCLNKLFTAVLNERLTNFIEYNEMLKENQAGFRKSYSTTDHIFSLYALTEILKSEKKKIFCSFVDFSKAFDSVWRSGLWGKLLHNNINGNFLRVLHNIYANVKAFVSINNQDSDLLISNRGLKQGDNVSPILFSMYLDDLEDYFDADGIDGVTIDYDSDDISVFLKIFVLLYADDTIIISDNAENFQKCLDSFFEYCNQWKLTVNESKSKIIVFGARNTDKFNFKFGDATLEIVDKYKYLGTYFSKSGSFLNARKHLVEQAKKAMYLLNMRIRNLELPVDLQLKLFDSTVLPILLYSADVWGFEDIKMIESLHNQFLRSITHTRKSTPRYMLYGELGRYPLEIYIKTKMISFWSKLLTNKQTKLSYILYGKLINTPNLKSKWTLKIKNILDDCGLSQFWSNQIADLHISKRVEIILKDQFLQKWNTDLAESSKGRTYSSFKESIHLEKYFTKLNPKSYINLVKFRTANHRFPCETLRWVNVEQQDRKCLLCNTDDVGDEMHYLLLCPAFSEERRKHLKRYYFTRPNMLKFKQLLNSQNVKELRNLCAFIDILLKSVITYF